MEYFVELVRLGRLPELREHWLQDPAILRRTDTSGLSLLHWAAYFDELDVINQFLGLDPTVACITTHKGMTAFHLAVLQKSSRVISFFLERHHTDEVNVQNSWGETALHLCAAMGDECILQKLVDAGCDQTLRDNWTRTAIDVAMQNGHGDVARRVLDMVNLTPQSATESQQVGLVQSEAVVSEFMQALAARAAAPSDVVVRVRHIFSHAAEALPSSSSAAANENTSKPLPLLGTILTPSAVCSDDWRRVCLSKRLEYPGDPAQVAAWLERSTRECTTSDEEQQHVRFVNGKDMFGLTALHKSASWDKVDLLQMLLSTRGVDVNVQNAEGFTALHCCVEARAMRTAAALLLDARLNIDATDKKGRTAKQLAAEVADIDFITLCSQSGGLTPS